MNTRTKVLIGLGVWGLIIGGIVLLTKTALGGGHFSVGNYIKLKDGTGPVWLVTDVKPNMQIIWGTTTYTGAYYLSQMPASSYTTALWPIQLTDANYNRVSYP